MHPRSHVQGCLNFQDRPHQPGHRLNFAMGASSTFAHAPLTKGIIIGTSLASLLFSGHKHFLDLPLKPHLTRDFQLWRIFVHHVACSNSADLFLIVLILWHTSVHVERRFGSVKYASFLAVSIVIGSFLELMALVVNYHLLGYRAIPSGPFLITFAILYQHHRIVPSLYDYRIGRVHFDSHSLMPDLLCLVLAFFNPTSSLVGILVSAAYRSEQFPLKRWRLKMGWLGSLIGGGDRRRRPRPTHAVLEDDPRFEATNRLNRRTIVS
ncbi:hypothetical protein O181_007036 [Austropuccinia psidii MF-1]|uniref:Peptidase S54 rhomboid domain-containing protein n=1 Tax=Austropuccinia psidii MF-1 TaxID=1389203 RepID=A0A9Q3GH98_9BASI|nr:hypothetical protein [Austropuccinia psidii MF-1]